MTEASKDTRVLEDPTEGPPGTGISAAPGNGPKQNTKAHPFDGIFGKKDAKIAADTGKTLVKISRADFKHIPWPYQFP